MGAGGAAQEPCRSLDKDALSEEFGRGRGPPSLEGDREARTGTAAADPSCVGETACGPSPREGTDCCPVGAGEVVLWLEEAVDLPAESECPGS